MDWSLFLSIAAIILAIPLAIIGNIITPKIKDLIGRRNLKNADKQITNIIKQLETIRNYREDTNKLLAFGIMAIMRVLILTTLVTILFTAFSSLLNLNSNFFFKFVLIIFYYLIVFIAIIDFTKIKRVLIFEEFNKEMNKRIEKLKKDLQKFEVSSIN